VANDGWGDYEVYLDQVLGRGGMGTVYKGKQVSVNRLVAIKVLKRDLTESTDFVRRFYREATLLAKLVDSRIVQVYGAGQAEGQHWYAMEFVEGEDLSTRIRRGYQFTHEEIVRISLETGEALAAAWREKIIHRDIKPSNIIMTKDNHVKVMDFGLAKNPENDLTQTEMIMGTAKYMSPEQATGGHCDIRSDLYALGAVLYELSTGTAPFVGESATAVIYQHVHKVPVSPEKLNPSLPSALCQVVMRLLAKDPKDRYQTPEDLNRDCKAIIEGVSLDEKTVLYHEVGKSPTGQTAGVPSPTIPIVTEEREGRGGLIVGLAAALLILGVGGFFLVRALRTGPVDPKTNGGGGGGNNTGGNGGHVQKPEWEKQYERLLLDAGVAAARRDWRAAKSSYSQALELLRVNRPEDARIAEIERKYKSVRFEEAIEEAGKKTELFEKIALYRQALEDAGSEEERKRAERLLRSCESEQAQRDGVQRMSRQDWSGAAQAFKEAMEKSDAPEDRARREKLHQFCSTMVEIGQLEREEKWDDAKAKVEQLQKGDVFEFGELLHKILEGVNGKIAVRDGARYKKILEEAQAHYLGCRWEDSGKKLDELEHERFAGFRDENYRELRKKIHRALKPPAGMVYVPKGTYSVGVDGDKKEFGPQHRVDQEEFYIDLKPVTAGEYGGLLAALGADGHNVLWCHADEAKLTNKSHRPRRFDGLTADQPVTEVDWFDAHAYAAWKGKRLPTEFELEIAGSWDVKAGKKRLYAWGDSATGRGPSPFGLEGLDDDLPEWTSSRYFWYRKTEEIKRDQWVLRGGYKFDRETELKTFFRFADYRDKAGHFGIRCARTIRADE